MTQTTASPHTALYHMLVVLPLPTVPQTHTMFTTLTYCLYIQTSCINLLTFNMLATAQDRLCSQNLTYTFHACHASLLQPHYLIACAVGLMVQALPCARLLHTLLHLIDNGVGPYEAIQNTHSMDIHTARYARFRLRTTASHRGTLRDVHRASIILPEHASSMPTC